VNQNESDNAGPIDEIDQWSNRMENLVNIKTQLENLHTLRDLPRTARILKKVRVRLKTT
jgi:hypothetical protein